MVSSAIPAAGTLLQVGDSASPENFTTIAEIVKIMGPASSVQKLEATSHSTSGGTREAKPGWIDPGEVTFDILYIPTNATHKATGNGLKALMVAKTIKNWKLIYPDGSSTTDSFPGYVSKFQENADFNQLLTASVGIQISSAMTLA